ncbi:MAG: hypothetical protein ACE5K0_02670 [Candidatus Methanofastidiosia archaeon]
MKKYILILSLILTITNIGASDLEVSRLIEVQPDFVNYSFVFKETLKIRALTSTELEGFEIYIQDGALELSSEFEFVRDGRRVRFLLNRTLNSGEELEITLTYIVYEYFGNSIVGDFTLYVETEFPTTLRLRMPQKKLEFEEITEGYSLNVEEKTILEWEFSEDIFIRLKYKNTGIDWSDTSEVIKEIEAMGESYTFKINYPMGAEELLEDVLFYIEEIFPYLISDISYPPPFREFTITLARQNVSAEPGTIIVGVNFGKGKLALFLENVKDPPSFTLGHEMVHSWFSGVPLLFNEGLAEYFGGRSLLYMAELKPILKGEIIGEVKTLEAEERYWRSVEEKYNKEINLMLYSYHRDAGSGVPTVRQGELNIAAYRKATYLYLYIARELGHETVQEFARVVMERKKEIGYEKFEEEINPKKLSVEEIVYLLEKTSKGNEVFKLLTKDPFNFEIDPPDIFEVKLARREASKESWWSALLFSLAKPETLKDVEGLKSFARKTKLAASLSLIFLISGLGFISLKKLRKMSLGVEKRRREKMKTENIDEIKLKLIEKFGSMAAYQAEIASKYTWERVDDEEVIKEFAREIGILE